MTERDSIHGATARGQRSVANALASHLNLIPRSLVRPADGPRAMAGLLHGKIVYDSSDIGAQTATLGSRGGALCIGQRRRKPAMRHVSLRPEQPVMAPRIDKFQHLGRPADLCRTAPAPAPLS